MIPIVIDAERRLCPDFCGLLDRCRVVAFLFLTLCEVCIIPFHFVLFGVVGSMPGLVLTAVHLLLLAGGEYLVWSRRVKLDKGVAGLFVLVCLKLCVDSVQSIYFGHPDDHFSVIDNMFIMFILAYTSLTLRLRNTNIAINILILLLLVSIFLRAPGYILFNIKAVFVAFVMNLFVAVVSMDFIQVGLRRKQVHMTKEEETAIKMMAEMKEGEELQMAALLGRLSPDLRQKVIRNVADHLQHEELEHMAWDQVCADLTKSETEICKLIVKGLTLKEICEATGKSESNITSQRSHIRKKLNMSKEENLKDTLMKRLL